MFITYQNELFKYKNQLLLIYFVRIYKVIPQKNFNFSLSFLYMIKTGNFIRMQKTPNNGILWNSPRPAGTIIAYPIHETHRMTPVITDFQSERTARFRISRVINYIKNKLPNNNDIFLNPLFLKIY